MKTKRWIAALLMTQSLIICFCVASVEAQTNVALCDIGLVFKSHPEFSRRLDELKQNADQFKINSNQIREQLIKKAEVLTQYVPGSAEFNEAETKLAQESATIEVEQRDIMRKLMQNEAELHYKTYLEVTNIISQYCQENGIQLVLRYNSTTMEPNNPQTIMQTVNGNVVYHQNQKDITAIIIQRIAQVNDAASRGQDNVQR